MSAMWTGRRLMAGVGAVQGLALWLLFDAWPDAAGLAAAYVGATAFLVAASLVVHMAWTGRSLARLALIAGAVGAVFAAIAWSVATGAAPEGARYSGDDLRVVSWALVGTVVLYVLGPYLQIFQASGERRFPYPELYRHAWSNFFIAVLGQLHACALWIVLWLWASLFGLIGIELFSRVFGNDLFQFVVTGAALGYGLAAARENAGVIDSLRGLTQALLRAILPLACLVTVAFLVTLPFTGLTPLFATQRAAAYLSAWILVYLVLLNAVYMDGTQEPPYSWPLRRLAETATMLLAVLAGIAGYALWLRIAEYGLSPLRVFACALVIVLALYALLYAIAAAARGAPWLPRLRTANFAMSWVVMSIGVALHTPLLDPITLSLESQLERLRTGRVSAADFDYAFLRFYLGRRGHQALQALAAAPGSEIAKARIDQALQVSTYYQWEGTERTLDDRPVFVRVPDGAPWPEGLEAAVRSDARATRIGDCSGEQPCYVADADIDSDGVAEALVLASYSYLSSARAFARDGTGWKALGSFRLRDHDGDPLGDAAWREAIGRGEVQAVPPKYSDLSVAGRVFEMQRE